MYAETIDGWREACDEVAGEMLAEAGLGEGPVDAFALAAALGVEVVLDRTLLGRTRFKRLGGTPTIFLKPDRAEERQHWALAKEIGERSLDRVLDRLTLDDRQRKIGGRLREQIATELAGRLLLPGRAFHAALDETGGDLAAMKERFDTASHELILLAMLRWPEWSVVTLFEDRQVIRRFGNRGPSPTMGPLEHEVWSEVRRTGRPVERCEDGVRVQGWAVGEGDDRRELLRTTEAPRGDRQLGLLDALELAAA